MNHKQRTEAAKSILTLMLGWAMATCLHSTPDAFLLGVLAGAALASVFINH